MAQNGTIYRVLVASPSDCVGERRLIPDVIYSWNAAHSLTAAAILDPMLWETHARPAVGDRPQSIINKQLVDNCDILVGTFWTRLGTATGRAESGTAEEIEEFRAKGKPVLLYFSSAPVVPDSLDHDQYRALTDYRKKLGSNGLCFQYESLNVLRDLLQRHIAATMADLHKPSPGSANAGATEKKDSDLLQYREQFSAFLRRLDAEWTSERDSGPRQIDKGQLILSSALRELVTFRSQIVTGLDEVTRTLDEVAISLRQLQRHQMFLDGGRSWKAFWESGDEALKKLKAILVVLDRHAGDGA